MTTKTNQKNKKIESGKKYVKYLSCFMFFYFGWRILAIPILFYFGAGELIGFFSSQLWFYLNLISSFCFALFGLICSYYFMKMKRWALISLIILFILHSGSILLNSYSLGQIKLPLVQITAIILLITVYRYVKK